MGVVLMVLIATPLAFALLAPIARIPARVWGPSTAAVSWVLALLVGAAVVVSGPVGWVVTAADGRATVGVHADQVAAVLLPLVCGISAVVQIFARRYLYADRYTGRFFTATAVLTTATTAAVTAVTLTGLAVAWTVAGTALCVLLGMYGGLATARDGVRRTARAFLIGDAALWTAVVTIVIRWGDLDLRTGHTTPLAASTWEVTLLAVLLVAAAASRSAQVPFHRWLPATLAAPTPVSALLHAGVVNAGAILLLRTGALFGASSVAMHVAFAIGAASTVYATVLMLTKPDIKGALVHSTMGQMGFMIMTCGLGLFAAAIFHLSAHGMYKATLFLGSGSAVHRHLRADHAPPAPALTAAQRWMVTGFAILAPMTALAVALRLLPTATITHDAPAVLVFAAAAGAWGSWAWLRRTPSIRRATIAAAAVLIAALAYLAALDALARFLQPALPAVGAHPASGSLVVLVAAALAAATAIRHKPGKPGLARLHDTLYVWALTNAHPVSRQRTRFPVVAATRRDTTAVQVGVPA